MQHLAFFLYKISFKHQINKFKNILDFFVSTENKKEIALETTLFRYREMWL